MFDHFVGDVEVHVPWGFGFKECTATGYSAVGFDDDGFRVSVYKLNVADERDSKGLEEVKRTTSFDPVPLAFHLYWTSLMVIEPLVETTVSRNGR